MGGVCVLLSHISASLWLLNSSLHTHTPHVAYFWSVSAFRRQILYATITSQYLAFGSLALILRWRSRHINWILLTIITKHIYFFYTGADYGAYFMPACSVSFRMTRSLCHERAKKQNGEKQALVKRELGGRISTLFSREDECLAKYWQNLFLTQLALWW